MYLIVMSIFKHEMTSSLPKDFQKLVSAIDQKFPRFLPSATPCIPAEKLIKTDAQLSSFESHCIFLIQNSNNLEPSNNNPNSIDILQAVRKLKKYCKYLTDRNSVSALRPEVFIRIYKLDPIVDYL